MHQSVMIVGKEQAITDHADVILSGSHQSLRPNQLRNLATQVLVQAFDFVKRTYTLVVSISDQNLKALFRKWKPHKTTFTSSKFYNTCLGHNFILKIWL